MSDPKLTSVSGRILWASAAGSRCETGFSNGFHAGREVSPAMTLAAIARECARLAAVQSTADGEAVLAEVQDALRAVREWRHEQRQGGV